MKTKNTENIKKKIRSLLALGRNAGASESERQLAMDRAEKIAKKYDISLSELDRSDSNQEMKCILVRFKNSNWRKVLYGAVCKYFGLYCVRKVGYGMWISGESSKIDMAMYLFDTLKWQMELQNFENGKSARENFRISFAFGVTDKVHMMSRSNRGSECTALVFHGQKRAEDFFSKSTGIPVKSGKAISYRLNSNARELGKNAQFVSGIHGQKVSKLG